MSDRWNDNLVESIVAGVMDRLRAGSALNGTFDSSPPARADNRPEHATIHISDRVITEALLANRADGASAITITRKAVVTPSARDFLRENEIALSFQAESAAEEPSRVLAIVIEDAAAIAPLVRDVLSAGRCELLGCVDDAAELAAGEIARGGCETALILSPAAHRAACLANRQPAVRAAAVGGLEEIRAVRRQLRANLWCVNPGGRSRFELKKLIEAATANEQGR